MRDADWIVPTSAGMSGDDAETTRRPAPMSARELVGHCVSGAVAGCAVEAAFYPLDTIKTRLQARRHGERVALFRGLYRGVGGNLLGVAPASAVFFAAYEPMKRALGASGGDAGEGEGGGGVGAHLTAGAAAGLASSLIRVPTEVIKTRRQVGTSAASSVRGIVAAHGVMGLFAGYWSFLLRDLPFDAIEFAGYESLKQAWGSFADKKDVNGAEAAALGAIAGAFTGAVTTPLDVVKTRLMTSPDLYTGVAQCVRKTVAEEGAMALLKGVEPRVMWIGLGGGCFFSVLETARGIFVPKREREAPP